MDLNIFKKEDKSGKMSKESYLLKTHHKELEYILKWSVDNDIDNIPFKQKVYLCINNINKLPICKNINCYKPTKFKNKTLGYYNYCSNKCIGSDPNIIKQKEQKSLSKWGTKTPAESKIIKDKAIKTNNQRYGHNSPMGNKDIMAKSKKTLLKNWGVDNPNKSSVILKRRIESFKKNIDAYKASYKKTSLDRYGVEHPWSNKDIHKKTIDKFYENYKSRIKSHISDDSNSEFVDIKKGDKTVLLFNCKECEEHFEILTYQFYWRVNNNRKICTICHPIDSKPSLCELELYDFIKDNYTGTIIQNDRSAINPNEIDVYLPELNLGFEFNGVYWHSDKFKSKNYHLEKYSKCKDIGIRLITIWEDDWNIKKDICKSFILNKLNKSSKIGARKCYIKEITYLESKKFLDDNHLQGDCKSSVRLALILGDEICSLMTFSKLRLALGGKNKEGMWELTRFCNKVHTTVIGGASKLFKYFLNNYEYIEVQSYSDNMISEGDLYEKLDFNYSHTSKPSYWYVVNKIRQHRFNWRKDKLVRQGYDKNKFEHEIMEEMGHYRVWSCGNKKWIYS